jgi:lipopolysaccharide transport system ATP-binding protein
MMTMSSRDTMIRADNICKCYRIGLKEDIHTDFAVAVFEFLKSPLKNYRKHRSLYRFVDVEPNLEAGTNGNGNDVVWALRGVSFQVERGEVLGIIGKNGAGKSTLLKILSRITDPSRGRVEIRGRVASLLEVGTGFHPELTGRENVYLNGTILGMTKKEVDQRFDEIVDFSGVERFIDTPVKRYSSGMTVRLAFSVAAHLDPEVLIVDEVLAVGDAEFQKKCLGKMESVSKEGRTILFVSHNMAAVAQLCGRAILLREGRVTRDGPASQVVSEYLSSGSESHSTWSFVSTSPNGAKMQVYSARVLADNNTPCSVFDFGSPIKVEIAYDIFQPIKGLCVICQLSDSKGTVIWTSWDTDTLDWKHGQTNMPGSYVATFEDKSGSLGPDQYYLSIGSASHDERFPYYERILKFEVSDVGYRLNPGRVGIIKPILKWEVSRTDVQNEIGSKTNVVPCAAGDLY